MGVFEELTAYLRPLSRFALESDSEEAAKDVQVLGKHRIKAEIGGLDKGGGKIKLRGFLGGRLWQDLHVFDKDGVYVLNDILHEERLLWKSFSFVLEGNKTGNPVFVYVVGA